MTTEKPGRNSQTFEWLVEEAIARIPQGIRKYLDNVLISVLPRPSRELLADLDLPPETDLFGIYTGVPLNERSLIDPPLYPDTIYIFQEPLEDFCQNQEELLEEIEITVVHEIAHFFGFDDEDLSALGYE